MAIVTTYSDSQETRVRVCPETDSQCEHGLSCPYVIDRYSCSDTPQDRTPPKLKQVLAEALADAGRQALNG